MCGTLWAAAERACVSAWWCLISRSEGRKANRRGWTRKKWGNLGGGGRGEEEVAVATAATPAAAAAAYHRLLDGRTGRKRRKWHQGFCSLPLMTARLRPKIDVKTWGEFGALIKISQDIQWLPCRRMILAEPARSVFQGTVVDC